MSAPKKKPTRAEQEEAAAERRRFAPVLHEAHARLGLWRVCNDKTCRRRESCGGDADQCGARVAAQGWGWLNHVIRAMREGKAQEAAIEAAMLPRAMVGEGCRAATTPLTHSSLWAHHCALSRKGSRGGVSPRWKLIAVCS
jgi:hypothetical protein